MFSDDGIGAGESLNSAKINSSIVLAGVSRCGLEINKEKSDWVGARKFSWIGYNNFFTLLSVELHSQFMAGG